MYSISIVYLGQLGDIFNSINLFFKIFGFFFIIEVDFCYVNYILFECFCLLDVCKEIYVFIRLDSFFRVVSGCLRFVFIGFEYCW